MSVSTIFQLYRVGQFYLSRRKPQTCCKSLTNFNHIVLYQVHLACVGFKLATLVVIGTDCLASYEKNPTTMTTS